MGRALSMHPVIACGNDTATMSRGNWLLFLNQIRRISAEVLPRLQGQQITGVPHARDAVPQ